MDIDNPGHTEAVNRPSLAALRTLSMLVGLVLLGVSLQGLWAGGFIGDLGGVNWLTLHAITGSLVVILALVAAVVAVTALRRHRVLVKSSVGLLALLLLQAGLGTAIQSERTLILIHVPLAMLIMGLGVYVSIAGARARRLVSRDPAVLTWCCCQRAF